MPPNDLLLVERDGPILSVTFNRPARRNAMTWDMYEGLASACSQANEDPRVRVMVLRGSGSKAFVAGTDIGLFESFNSGADGLAYEERITRVITRLETVRVPTIAAVNGYCVGGGLVIAAVCDLRVVGESAVFGVPTARTLGNCLSMNTYSILVHHFGAARTLDLLIRSRMVGARDAEGIGFASEVCSDDDVEAKVAEVVALLLSQAPLSMWAAKQSISRLRRQHLPDGDDIVTRVFGSDDFHRAVAAFKGKQTTVWTGS